MSQSGILGSALPAGQADQYGGISQGNGSYLYQSTSMPSAPNPPSAAEVAANTPRASSPINSDLSRIGATNPGPMLGPNGWVQPTVAAGGGVTYEVPGGQSYSWAGAGQPLMPISLTAPAVVDSPGVAIAPDLISPYPERSTWDKAGVATSLGTSPATIPKRPKEISEGPYVDANGVTRTQVPPPLGGGVLTPTVAPQPTLQPVNELGVPTSTPMAQKYAPDLDRSVNFREETIEGRIQNILGADANGNYTNPVVRQAADRAMQAFAGRGLLNSSMAQQAAIEAATSKAIEIAGPDAQTYFSQGRANQDAKNVFARDVVTNTHDMTKFDKQMDMTGRELDMKGSQFDRDLLLRDKELGIKGGQFDRELSMKGDQFNRDLLLRDKELGVKGGQFDRDLLFRDKELGVKGGQFDKELDFKGRELTSREKLADKELSFKTLQSDKDFANKITLADKDNATRVAVSNGDNKTRTEISDKQITTTKEISKSEADARVEAAKVAAQDARDAATLSAKHTETMSRDKQVADSYDTYMRRIASIDADSNLDADAKIKAKNSAGLDFDIFARAKGIAWEILGGRYGVNGDGKQTNTVTPVVSPAAPVTGGLLGSAGGYVNPDLQGAGA